MRYRKLRIAFSATCLIACVLLIVLWVRSYWWNDGISGTNGSAFTRILTVQGNIYLQRLAPNRGGPIPWKSFHRPIARNTSVPHARFLVLANGWEVAIPF